MLAGVAISPVVGSGSGKPASPWVRMQCETASSFRSSCGLTCGGVGDGGESAVFRLPRGGEFRRVVTLRGEGEDRSGRKPSVDGCRTNPR